jgi:hypothetical protein
VAHWSLSTLREKLVKTGARIVRHGRYVVFQLAEVAVPRSLFAEILRRIGRLRGSPPSIPGTGPSGESPVHSYIEYKMAKFLLKLIGKERSYDLAGGCLASSRRGSPTAENRRVDRGAATGHPSASWPGTVQGSRRGLARGRIANIQEQ